MSSNGRSNGRKGIGWLISPGAVSPEEQRFARRSTCMPEAGNFALYEGAVSPQDLPRVFLGAIRELNSDGLSVTSVYLGSEAAEFGRMASEIGVPAILRPVEPGVPADYSIFQRAVDVVVRASGSCPPGLPDPMIRWLEHCCLVRVADPILAAQVMRHWLPAVASTDHTNLIRIQAIPVTAGAGG